MRQFTYVLALIITILFLNCTQRVNVETSDKEITNDREYYQLKIYTFESVEQVQMTENYLKEAYLPGLRRQGIENIGVFKPIPSEEDTLEKLYLLIPMTSLSQVFNIEEELLRDESYLAAGSDYINASHDTTPYHRIEISLLRAFENMPELDAPEFEGPREDRVYELRNYESATEAYHIKKVDMFNTGGEIVLFEKLGFNAVFYAQVISGSQMPNLMYMTTFPDQESRDAHWDSFRLAPEWLEMRDLPQYQNTVSHIDIFFLYPTEYSDY